LLSGIGKRKIFLNHIMNLMKVKLPTEIASQVQPHADWRLARPHQNLISYFLQPRQIHNLDSFQKWSVPLREPVENAIQRLIENELVVTPDKQYSLIASFTGDELRRFLSSCKLSTAGNKHSMAARLVEQAPDETTRILQKCRVLICSEKGVVIARAYLDYEKQRLEEARKNSANAIREQRWSDAETIIRKFNQDCVFPRGFSLSAINEYEDDEVDSQTTRYSTTVEVLRRIYYRTPILAKNNGWDKFPDVNFYAAMFYLWGNAIEAGIECSDEMDEAANAYISHAFFLAKIALYKSIGVKYVQLTTCNDDFVCKYCSKMAVRKFLITEIPELPHEKCTSPAGCRCNIKQIHG
jgi:hypothetical protein